MKPEEKLDQILRFLNDSFLKDDIKFQHSKTICELSKLKVSPAEAYMILQKLNLDGYVEVLEENQWMFKINYNGIIFNRTGGYTSSLLDLKRKRFKEEIYNILVAVGTTLAGLYGVWQLFTELF